MCDVENLAIYAKFMNFLPQFTRFHVEENWAQKYICGEKMTNIRSEYHSQAGSTGLCPNYNNRPFVVLPKCARERTHTVYFVSVLFDLLSVIKKSETQILAWFNFAENQDGRVFGESWPLALFAGYPQQHSNWGAEIQVALETRFENPLINMRWSAIIILIFLLISDSDDMEDMLADIMKADELISAMEEKLETM